MFTTDTLSTFDGVMFVSNSEEGVYTARYRPWPGASVREYVI